MRDRRLPSWAPTAGVVLALVALVAWSFWQRMLILFESPFPVGVDGYFYPVQLRSLLSHGHLAYPASQLSFWLMAPLAALTDPIAGAKLGAALFGALIAVPSYGVGARLGASRGAGLIAAVIATTSAGSAYLTIEFVKNGVGLTVAMCTVWLLLRLLETPSSSRIAAFLAGVIAAFLAHKMAAAIVFTLAVPAVIAECAGRGVLRGRRLLYVIGAIVTFAGGALVLGVLAPRRFVSPGDAALVGHLWSSTTHWDAPALVNPTANLAMGHEAMLGGLLAVAAAFTLSRRLARMLAPALQPVVPDEPAPKHSAGERAVAWMIVLSSVAIALPWIAVEDPQGLGFRLRIVAFVPMALCAAILARPVFIAGTLALALIRPMRPAAWIREIVYVVVALALVVMIMPGDRTEGRVITHPALVAAAQALDGQIPAGDIAIVPERHIAFMVAWYANVEISTRPEPIARAHRWRVMPLAFIGLDSPLDHALIAARRQPGLAPPIGLHPRHANGMVVVKEATWEWILDQLPDRARAHFRRWPVI